ncbi:regulator of G-protein signaling 21 isoform X1 [Ammospiza nelsoni]|uniref:regulator of G-protein signaling 21 isoform X1 n=2 Tax=Ammospiza TaxID=2517974 RepID=UPI00286C7F62|nr:regulator of G-protein signaling 21 isoform X1 [Ammospiza nelsoni]
MEWNGINRGQVLRSINTLNCWETSAHPLESVSFSHFVLRSNAGETMAWSESVDTVLSNKEGLAAFRTFLKSEFSEENVEFWLACEDFKKTKSSSKIALKAQKIYSDFIQADAPKEINIDFHTKNDISQNISEPTLCCFDAAQSSIYCLMAKDSFPRFLRSEVYKELVKKHQDRNQKRWLPFL